MAEEQPKAKLDCDEAPEEIGDFHLAVCQDDSFISYKHVTEDGDSIVIEATDISRGFTHDRGTTWHISGSGRVYRETDDGERFDVDGDFSVGQLGTQARETTNDELFSEIRDVVRDLRFSKQRAIDSIEKGYR